ncbi:hypothetical protein KH5_16500 [Urechidicola sp. KH5]
MSTQFNEAIALFDEANAADPHTELSNGKEVAKELLYAQRMTQQLEHFEPYAAEVVKLAVRCQHICRWEIPRDSYEMNRKGYLTWRKDLAKFHAEKAGGILESVGYASDIIKEVQALLQKKQLKRNANTQLLEDVICLVFLTHYFEKFSKKYSEDKLIDILQKTWKKMSSKGHEFALKIPFSESSKSIIAKALA